jgi:hypothetical protein
LYENLVLQKILKWQPGSYTQGDVFRNPDVENSLLVVLRNFEFTDPALSPESFILDGAVSAPKDFQPWAVGNNYYANNETTGFYDPDVIEMEQELTNGGLCQRKIFEPAGEDNLAYRIGWYCYVVNNDFTLQPSTDTTTGAQTSGNVSNSQVGVPLLKSGGTYLGGTWLKTPAVGAGANEEIDPYYFYVDRSRGAITRFAYVRKTFTFLPSVDQTLNQSFEQLIGNGTLEAINAVDGSLPQPLFQYTPRFEPQTLISFKETSSSPLQYYFSLTGFTPTSANPTELEKAGFISRIDTSAEIAREINSQLLPNPITGEARLCPPQSMFVFAPGDTTLFREQNTIVSFLATRHFTPIFTPGVYISAGVLVPTTGDDSSAIPFFSSTNSRELEELILSEDGRSIYRVVRFFTAKSPAFNWDGEEVVNTTRIEELSGNLLRVVTRYDCEEQIKAPNGPDTSGIKLGVTQMSLRSKNALGADTTFVWENTNFSSEVPALSYATGGKEVFKPVSYGDGTLAL